VPSQQRGWSAAEREWFRTWGGMLSEHSADVERVDAKERQLSSGPMRFDRVRQQPVPAFSELFRYRRIDRRARKGRMRVS
jgi:hypothetical protein